MEKSVVKKKLIIENKEGLHARPAALFVQLANKFNSTITVKKGRRAVNGKSIMGILTLGADYGSQIQIIVKGEDAHEAIGQLEKLLTSNE
jgi:phosphocarrier protein